LHCQKLIRPQLQMNYSVQLFSLLFIAHFDLVNIGIRNFL
jgi:hypothetical protein